MGRGKEHRILPGSMGEREYLSCSPINLYMLTGLTRRAMGETGEGKDGEGGRGGEKRGRRREGIEGE